MHGEIDNELADMAAECRQRQRAGEGRQGEMGDPAP